MQAFGISLALLGAASMVAALAGALNVAGVAEFPVMKSKALRVILFVVGSLFVLLGFGAMGQAETASPDPSSNGGSDDGGDSGGGNGGNGSSDVNAAVYVRDANAACIETGQEIAALTMPAPDAPDDLWLDYTLGYADALSSLRDKLNVLAPPPGSSDEHATLLDQLGLISESYYSAATALRAGDPQGYNNHLDNANGYKATYNRYAQQLSLSQCGFES